MMGLFSMPIDSPTGGQGRSERPRRKNLAATERDDVLIFSLQYGGEAVQQTRRRRGLGTVRMHPFGGFGRQPNKQNIGGTAQAVFTDMGQGARTLPCPIYKPLYRGLLDLGVAHGRIATENYDFKT
jgi:hypothetical protein